MYKILQNVNFSYRSSQEPMMTIWNALYDFVTIRQHPNQSVQEYYEKFSNLKEVNTSLGINIHAHMGAITEIAKEKGLDPDNLTDSQKDDLMASIGEARVAAIHMLTGADRTRFGGAITVFAHSYLMDRKNQYPADTIQQHDK
eukprot:scaffold18188_cov20-Cyclotella_meneghiniana.AAC.2